MEDSRTPIVTAPLDLILSRVALLANAPWAHTTADTSNAALIPDFMNEGECMFNSFNCLTF
jgi:hypothetical protein